MTAESIPRPENHEAIAPDQESHLKGSGPEQSTIPNLPNLFPGFEAYCADKGLHAETLTQDQQPAYAHALHGFLYSHFASLNKAMAEHQTETPPPTKIDYSAGAFADLDLNARTPETAPETLPPDTAATHVPRKFWLFPPEFVSHNLTNYLAASRKGSREQIHQKNTSDLREKHRPTVMGVAHQSAEVVNALAIRKRLHDAGQAVAADAVIDLLTAYGMTQDMLRAAAMQRIEESLQLAQRKRDARIVYND